MIKFEDIHKELTVETLSEHEQDYVKAAEELTDEHIKIQFPHSYYICIDGSKLDRIFSGKGIYRKQVMLNEWKKMYTEAGWDVSHDSEHNSWTLRGK
jgi:hypothetical protein